MAETVESTRSARAKRVRSIRKVLKLSRREFAKRFGVSAGTLQHWEQPDDRYGLSEKAANRLINVLTSIGVHISLEWLLHGLGEPPQISSGPFKTSTASKNNIKNIEPKSAIEEELALFYKIHKNAIHAIINDDGMAPNYNLGDYVAGIKYDKKDITTIINENCIIINEEGEVLVRYVSKGNLPNHYTLKCTNFHSTVNKPVLYDVKIVSAAPIIWIRKNLIHNIEG